MSKRRRISLRSRMKMSCWTNRMRRSRKESLSTMMMGLIFDDNN